MTKSIYEPAILLRNLSRNVRTALLGVMEYNELGYHQLDPTEDIKTCYIQLLAVAEALGLPELRNMIFSEFQNVSDFGILNSGPDEPYSPLLTDISCYLQAMKQLFPADDSTTIRKDLLEILKDIHYPINDQSVFGSIPRNETDVHNRIEAILKCVFPDLKRKPAMPKQIKSFVPDTGIPSIKTLIEYKYLNDTNQVGKVADEILADTRGYTSDEWKHVIYVIYETKRFRTERDWNLFLEQSHVPESTRIIVLSGEQPSPKNPSVGS